MTVFKKIFIYLSAAFCLLQSACGSSAKERSSFSSSSAETTAAQEVVSKKILKVNIRKEPHTLDPARARDLYSITIAKALFDGLTRINHREHIEMALAESVDIAEDFRIYTFKLRDAHWTNGDSITAHDFVYAWRRIVDPSFPAENAFQLYVVKNGRAIRAGELPLDALGVRALDEKTLEVELENPVPYFLELTSYPAFFPVNIRVDQTQPGWAEDIELFVNNGPFLLKNWDHQDSLYVEKNPRYWDVETVKLDGIRMVMVQDEAEIAMFENQEIDWAGSPLSTLSLDAVHQLNESWLVHKKPILGTYYLNMNTQKGPCSSAKIRRAFSLSLDRDALVEHVLAGTQTATENFVPVTMGLPCSKVNSSESAVQLFKEGFQEISPSGAPLPPLQLLYFPTERDSRIVQTLKEQWQKTLGVKIELCAMERPALLERMAKGDFDLATGNWMADYNDPLTFLDIFKSRSCSANRSRWESPEYTQILEESSKTMDQHVRMDLLAKCEKILLDAMPIIPIFQLNMFYVKQDYVEDVVLSSMGGWDFKWASVSAKHGEDLR